MHEVLVNRLGGLSLPRKSVVRLTDRPDMTLDVYRGRKTTMQKQQQKLKKKLISSPILAFADTQKPFFLSVEASGTAIGYILGQKDSEGREAVICYGGVPLGVQKLNGIFVNRIGWLVVLGLTAL